MYRTADSDNYSLKVGAVDRSDVADVAAVAAGFAAEKIAESAGHHFGQLETRPFSTNKADAVQNNRFDCSVLAEIVRILFRKICKNLHRYHFLVRSFGKA